MYLYFWAIVVVFVFLRWLTGQELDDWVHQRPNPLIFHLYLYIWAFVFVFLRGKELDDGHRHSPRPGGWWASHFPFVFVFVWVRASILSFSICICISEHLYLYGPEDKNLMIETVTAPGWGWVGLSSSICLLVHLFLDGKSLDKFKSHCKKLKYYSLSTLKY